MMGSTSARTEANRAVAAAAMESFISMGLYESNSCQRNYKKDEESLSGLGARWELGVPQIALGAAVVAGVWAVGSRAVVWKERVAQERKLKRL